MNGEREGKGERQRHMGFDSLEEIHLQRVHVSVFIIMLQYILYSCEDTRLLNICRLQPVCRYPDGGLLVFRPEVYRVAIQSVCQ